MPGTGDSVEGIKHFLMALAFTQPRIMAMFIPIPIFNRAILPGMLRMAIGAAFGVVVAPSLVSHVAAMQFDATTILAIAVKEAMVGFILGILIAVPFWAFEGIGFLIDNQRGASIAATLNPLTGNDSSPMGILFNQAFIVFFFISGAFLLMLELLFNSFALWNVFTWTPHFKPETIPLLIEQVMRLVKLALLLASPAIVAMFLSEVGLALVSRFVPNLQVFFMAMPIKSALALLVLMVYMATLFEYATDLIAPMREIVPTLDGHWKQPAGGTR
jgi:type III secretion protein T